MRKLHVAILTLGLAANLHAQGTLMFNNRISSNIFAPVFDVDGATMLSGTNYFAQLYAGPAGAAESALVAVAKPVPFRTDQGAGSWRMTEVAVPSVRPGEGATLQVRVWFNRGGAIKSYEAALREGVLHGKCPPFPSLPLGGGMGLPPSIINNARATNNLPPIVCTAGADPPRAAPER
jgi:hypothetical protein